MHKVSVSMGMTGLKNGLRFFVLAQISLSRIQCTRCPKARQRKVNLWYDDRLNCAQRFPFLLMYNNISNFAQKDKRENLGLKHMIVDTGTLKRSK